jgi:HEAT repeat protein
MGTLRQLRSLLLPGTFIIAIAVGIAAGHFSTFVGAMLVVAIFAAHFVTWWMDCYPVRIGPERASAMALRLRDRRTAVRRRAAKALRGIRSESRALLPDLIDAMADTDPVVREAICLAIARLGPDAEAAVPSLIKGLVDPATRLAALVAIREIGPGASEAVPALVEIVRSPNVGLQITAAQALWRITECPDIVISIILPLFHHPTPAIRRVAPFFFREMKGAAIYARAALCDALSDRDRMVRKLAAQALQTIPR